MTDPSRLRDSTQIVLPTEDLDGLREELESRFVVTIVPEGERFRIVGSPVEIKEVGEFLTKHGVRLP